LWISTYQGLCRFNINTLKTQNFTKEYGLQDDIFEPQATCQTQDGTLYFGGAKGFNRFSPYELKLKARNVPLIITSIHIFEDKIIADLDSSIRLDLKHNQKSISFEFALLDYTSNVGKEYTYMLKGIDEKPIVTQTRNFASYTNLPSGEYTFVVEAKTKDGFKNSNKVAVNFTIATPFWKAIWFYVLIAVLTLIIIRFIYKLREKQLLLEQKRMQEEIDKAVAEVEEQKTAIMQQNEQLHQQQEAEKERNWAREGLANLTDIMNSNRNELDKLAKNTISELANYVEAYQAGLFILNSENDVYLELQFAYAYDQNSKKNKRIEIGEGLVGTCFKNKQTEIITNIPDNYLKISSGLGATSPKRLLLIPLIFDNKATGVIELSFLNELVDYKKNFIELAAEKIASQIITTKLAQKTTKLLEFSQKQSSQFKQQEEEARKQIEAKEMQIEELERKLHTRPTN